MPTITAEQATKRFNYTLREVDATDLPTIANLSAELEQREPMDQAISLEELKGYYNRPDNHDIIMLAHLANQDGSEGKAIGYLLIQEHGSPDAWGQVTVHPDYRNNGVGSALYEQFEQRAQEKNAPARHMVPNQKATLLIDFLAKRGYEAERYFWQMRLPAEHPSETAQLPADFSLRTFVPGQDEALFMQVANGTFADHYGHTDHSLEETTYATKRRHFRPDGLFFAFHGDEIAGFCYTAINPDEIARRGIEVGWINMLGVMPAYRRHGLGRVLLLTGVNYLRQFVPIVELGVEGKNAKALPLYESVGFQRSTGNVNMMKVLPDSAGQELGIKREKSVDRLVPGASISGVALRDVTEADLPIFYEHQLDPIATQMAAFPARNRDAFMAHWHKILADATGTIKTVVFDGQVAGNIVSFNGDGEREVGYWIGREYWGKGIASQALAAFLAVEQTRPLYAHVAKHNIASQRVLEKCGFTFFGEDKDFSDTPGEEVEGVILILT